MNIVKSLAQSRKAWVLLIAIACVSGLAYTGRIDGQVALEFVKWLVTAWFGAVALEDGAHKLMLPPPNTKLNTDLRAEQPPQPLVPHDAHDTE
jgi:hypothetical protein